MSASLVGSGDVYKRQHTCVHGRLPGGSPVLAAALCPACAVFSQVELACACLLYTSDAADDM
eukprot:2915685-Alexandrium_andersonii.AAC.1